MATEKKVARRKKLLSYEQALVGYVFILTLAQKRREEIPTWAMSFNQIKDDIARSIKEQRVTHYRDLSSDAKSFVSRCSGIKNQNKSVGYITIARQQLLLIQHEGEQLYLGAIIDPSTEAQKAIDNRKHCEAYRLWFEERKPEFVAEWNAWAEMNPQLAFID
jgi:hypothetical protein